METPLSEPAKAPETAYTLHQPGRLVDALESCMADRLRPGRSGWSAAEHLGRDLERFYGVRAPTAVIERALRDLSKHRRVQRKVDTAGVLWYRLRTG
jgi:hypothetical protein